jgi:hypothetical protein
MNRRKDYREFKQVLEKYNISRFYHFTDRENVDSIIRNGGLFSYGDCIKQGIHISRPGGSELSHELDEKENLQNYVRVSICKKHPMMYYAIQDERIVNPVILEIDTDILFIEGNIFSDKNAVRSDSHKGGSFVDFNRIHFNTASRRSQFDVDEDEQEYYQAEILVPHHIPLHYILNIADFQTRDIERGTTTVKRPYSSIISEGNPVGVFFILNQSDPTKEIISFDSTEMSKASAECGIIDQVINELIVRNTSNGVIDDRYNIAVLGYGDYVFNCLKGKGIQSLNELNDNPIFVKTHIKEIRTRQGAKTIEQKRPVWVKPRSRGGAYLNKALNSVKKLVDKWTEEHMDSFPPIIIHITEYRYHGAEDSEMIQLAKEIKSLLTNDGNALFFNIHLTWNENTVPVVFPSNESKISESYYGSMYYLMSSVLPQSFYNNMRIRENSTEYQEQHIGFAMNIKISDLLPTILSIIPK